MSKERSRSTSAATTALANWPAVEGALFQLGKVLIEKKKIEATINERIQKIEEHFQGTAADLAEREAHVKGEIEQFVREHQGEMESGTFKCTYGKARFRLNPKKVNLLRGRKEEKVVEALQEIGRDEMLRETVVLNRQAILDQGLDTELEKVGIRIVQTETFKAEPDLKTIETVAADMARATA